MSEPDQETALSLLDTTAAMLRGMTMDPAIPRHAKEAMWSRIATLEAFVEHALADGEQS